MIQDPCGGLGRRKIGDIEIEHRVRRDIDQTCRVDERSHAYGVDRLQALPSIGAVHAPEKYLGVAVQADGHIVARSFRCELRKTVDHCPVCGVSFGEHVREDERPVAGR